MVRFCRDGSGSGYCGFVPATVGLCHSFFG